MGHNHCYMCFDLNARNPATDAMPHMQPEKRHWINSTIAQVFVDYLTEFPKQGARDACWHFLVNRGLATGGQMGEKPSALVACLAQFIWPVNEGKHRKSLVILAAGPKGAGKGPEPTHFTFNFQHACPPSSPTSSSTSLSDTVPRKIL
jgi:hypothetical protein